MTISDLYLVSRKTALVAIDLQNAIMGISAAPYPATQVVQRNRKIADELRARGGLVVWVRVDLKQFIQLPVDEPSPLAGKPLPDELSEIVRSAGFQDGDLLITKRHWGAFAGTSLEPELRSRGIDTVVLTGISTNGGVESTLRQGTGLGFAFVVVEDACSGQDAEEHRFAFERIFPRLARVRTVEEVLKALARADTGEGSARSAGMEDRLGCGAGSFLSQLDATVVNVSLSSLAAELNSSLPVIQWGTSGYV